MTRTVEIDPNETQTHFFGSIQKETQTGIKVSWVPAVKIRGRTYHYLDSNEWLDIKSGEILKFRCQGFFI